MLLYYDRWPNKKVKVSDWMLIGEFAEVILLRHIKAMALTRLQKNGSFDPALIKHSHYGLGATLNFRDVASPSWAWGSFIYFELLTKICPVSWMLPGTQTQAIQKQQLVAITLRSEQFKLEWLRWFSEQWNVSQLNLSIFA